MHLEACAFVCGILEPKKDTERKKGWAEHQMTWVLDPLMPPTGFLDLDFRVWKRRSLGIIRDSQTEYSRVLASCDLN